MVKPKYIHFHLSKDQSVQLKQQLKNMGMTQKEFILDTLLIITEEDIRQAKSRSQLLPDILEDNDVIRISTKIEDGYSINLVNRELSRLKKIIGKNYSRILGDLIISKLDENSDKSFDYSSLSKELSNLAANAGMTKEQFIIQTLMEKVNG